MSLVDLLRKFPNDEAAEKWIAECRWGDEPYCPHCGDTNVQVGAKHPSQPYRCRGCRNFFSVKTGTAMAGSNLGPQVWAITTYLLSTGLKGQASVKLHRDLGISHKSAWFLAHRLREAWENGQSPFAVPIEVYEPCIGGLEKNKHASKKANLVHGPAGAATVVGAKDRESNQVEARVIERTDTARLQGFIHERTTDGAKVYTAEALAFAGMPKREAVKHSVGEYVNGRAQATSMESFWGMTKRSYHGTCRWMRPKHLRHYVNEFSGRHNIRPSGTIDQVRTFIRGLEGKRLQYREFTA